IPAWLSAGEYVVNARSAGANTGLLDHINRSQGPVYRADGGFAEEFERFRRRKAERVGDDGPGEFELWRQSRADHSDRVVIPRGVSDQLPRVPVRLSPDTPASYGDGRRVAQGRVAPLVRQYLASGLAGAAYQQTVARASGLLPGDAVGSGIAASA